MTYKEKLLKIFEKHGLRSQSKKLCEEANELLEACIDYANNKNLVSKNHVEEEIADVLVIINQLIDGLNLNERYIIMWQKYKINRQCKRDGIK